jgi:acetolactate synthase-1/2/3 large subunit
MDKERLDGGEAIVQAFRDLDIDYVFSSPGSEWSPLWEAFARQVANSGAGPTYLGCGHETLAVDLAMGYTMATGRMQAVVLHAGSGLMQGSMGIASALASATPMVVLSGECLGYGDQEEYDPGSQWYAYLGVVGGPQRLVEPVVKWAQQAASPATLYPMVVRAGELAQRLPAGPAYLSVPLETLMQGWSPPQKPRKVPRAPHPQAAEAEVKKVAQLLLRAQHPVIMTESGGREPEGYQALIELAELLSIPVAESPFSTVANFPKDNPLHQGFDAKPLLEQADLVLVVRNRVPWYPPKQRPERATVVVIDEAPFKMHMVYQNLQADLFLEGDVPSSLGRLADSVRAARPDPAQASARRARWGAAHRQLDEARAADEEKARRSSAIHPIALCAAMGEVLPQNSIYVDETTTHRGIVHRHVANRGQLSFVRTPSGLGQVLGLALGLKLACPDRPVVALVGDGAFLYNPVVPALAFGAAARLPIMVVVFNNRGYQSMRKNQLNDYPGGAGARHGLLYGSMLAGVDYEQLAAPFGAVGIRVSDPGDLKAALERGHAAVREGRTAIINAVLESP